MSDDIYQLDRWVAVVKPRERFLQWLQSLPDGEGEELTLEQLRGDCVALLIPEFDDADEAVAFVYSMAEDLFEAELAGWCDDEKLWPARRGVEAFMEWFDVEVHSTVIDVEED